MKRLITRSAHLAVSLTAIIGMSTAASAQQVDIIPEGSTWDYLFTSIDDGTGALLPADPFTANNVAFTSWSSVGWADANTTLTFNDGRSAPWASGPALFGYGDNVTYGTPLPTPETGNRDVTHYFRHEFTTTEEFNNLTFSVNVDDGVVVYLDGIPFSSMTSCCEEGGEGGPVYDVADVNDPRFSTPPGYRDTSQTTNGPGGGEGTWYTEQSFLLAGLGTLAIGDHVLGLEAHQANGTSSDMRLDFRFFQNVDGEWAGDEANNGGFFDGGWNNAALWSNTTVPNSAGANARLLQIPTGDTTVYSNSDVTVGKLEFDNSNKYAIAGLGTFIFESDDAANNAVIDVAQGDHEIQAQVSLTHSTDVTVAAGASLEFNNDVAGNGNSLNVSGGGLG